MKLFWAVWSSVAAAAGALVVAAPGRPNVVLIMSDDMGWHDVSHHGSDQILTPNIDSLAYAGAALHRYYTNPLCTPSRAALLTGKYAHKIGMQGYPLVNSEDRGIPLSEKLLPEYLKELGYRTHLVGKWHVGACREQYLPTRRGFDSHFGFRGGQIDYYEYIAEEDWATHIVSGLDLFRNETPAWDVSGYLTDVLTDEAVKVIREHDTSAPLFLQLAHAAPHAGSAGAALQAPPNSVRDNRHVRISPRRLLAGVMTKLDDGIGEVIEALSDRNMLNNTIVVFVADNGGMTRGLTGNFASNYPLRGEKFTPFEGGVRVSGTIWSRDIQSKIWQGMMHVSDWLPTIISAVGGKPPENIDGVDLWRNILEGSESKRNTTVVDINDVDEFGSIIMDGYKMIKGLVPSDYSVHMSQKMLDTIGEVPDYWERLTQSKTCKAFSQLGIELDRKEVMEKRRQMTVKCTRSEEIICMPDMNKSCLFNIISDPCEYHDLTESRPDLAAQLSAMIDQEMALATPRLPLYRDPAADPILHNNTWMPFKQLQLIIEEDVR